MRKRGYADPPWIFKGNALYQLNLVRCVPAYSASTLSLEAHLHPCPVEPGTRVLACPTPLQRRSSQSQPYQLHKYVAAVPWFLPTNDAATIPCREHAGCPASEPSHSRRGFAVSGSWNPLPGSVVGSLVAESGATATLLEPCLLLLQQRLMGHHSDTCPSSGADPCGPRLCSTRSTAACECCCHRTQSCSCNVRCRNKLPN